MIAIIFAPPETGKLAPSLQRLKYFEGNVSGWSGKTEKDFQKVLEIA